MMIRKVTVEEQRDLIPDAKIKDAFLKRPDIAGLTEKEQERKWIEQLKKINQFRAFLAKCDSVIVELPEMSGGGMRAPVGR